MQKYKVIALALSAQLFAINGAAQTFLTDAASSRRAPPALIDDSATVVLDPSPKFNWRSNSPKSRDNTIVAKTRVNVKLATLPWLNKKGKIYMLMPAETAGTIMLSWRGTGQLADGQLKSGGRALVYQGVIRNPRIEDIWDIEITADGSRNSQIQQLRIYYEIEVE